MPAPDLRKNLPTLAITVAAFKALPELTDPLTVWTPGARFRRNLTPTVDAPQWIIVDVTGPYATVWYKPVPA